MGCSHVYLFIFLNLHCRHCGCCGRATLQHNLSELFIYILSCFLFFHFCPVARITPISKIGTNSNSDISFMAQCFPYGPIWIIDPSCELISILRESRLFAFDLEWLHIISTFWKCRRLPAFYLRVGQGKRLTLSCLLTVALPLWILFTFMSF